jgi:chemotaxis protein CheD
MHLAVTSSGNDPLPEIFLRPASLYCSLTPTIVTTVLGSCVAVCLWNRKHSIGGMNHFVLPSGSSSEIDARYGDTAISRLIEEMAVLGCVGQDLEAKIFGGAEVLSFGAAENNVGTKNVEMAMGCLARRTIPITARRTGGKNGVLIRFSTQTGHVLVRRISA